ncbi:sigma 54-interacting transcriptional regulator [Pseudomonas schmalbachii]|uniref:Sigma 54-interacting transcriptional regulator n=1 Tax=Pseudomonas schmalbachii TaxID=2816993 RepID=A0ABS3TUM3_9PSED|nr:sigma 54-interacting transcriptional regulator [Pseudomonas schmalbachii]MBO3277359.1 sigma 54-interacting transcriptional regulator [Pseudomonas schmalbachii]
MLSQIPQPLRYAEALLHRYAGLAGVSDPHALLEKFVEAIAELSGCELVQLYLLDATHTCLHRSAESHLGHMQLAADTALPADYRDAQLLQFALCQNRIISLDELNPSLHETGFLPATETPWRSLLCIPLPGPRKTPQGVLLCASRQPRDLRRLADSLGQLGAFVLGQLHLLRRLQAPQQDSPAPAPVARPGGYGLIGDSPAMRRTCQLIGKVLHAPCTVLITGETGTGKELVARAVHECGSRRNRPFIVQNCAALPENLLESELFGYRKGAFTGADRDRQGLLDAADGGTLFLDEVGDMPLALQAKLLRVLQDGEVRPLGSSKTHRVDVRVIAATHRDLSALVSDDRFREDLYYRLMQFPIELPPLRQRGEDIAQLARHFAEKACAFFQRPPCQWSGPTLARLSSHAFPGNVRELKGLVERAVLLCEGNILLPEHFPFDEQKAGNDRPQSLRERLEQMERKLLIECLQRNGSNQANAAQELGLPRRTLQYRMSRLKISLGKH